MRKLVRILSILMLLKGTSLAANTPVDSVRFFGSAPAYAGINLLFDFKVNPLIPSKAPLAVVPIDQHGHFDLSFPVPGPDRKSTRLNSSHVRISYAVFCL